MNKRGFTLVELLAVLVIMIIIMVIAIPSIIGLMNKSKTKMFCEKVDNIVSSAKLYGEDHIDEIGNGLEISVKDLIKTNYVKKENSDCNYDDASKPCITDPRSKATMDNETLTLTIKNKRAYATFNFKSEDINTCK